MVKSRSYVYIQFGLTLNPERVWSLNAEHEQ